MKSLKNLCEKKLYKKAGSMDYDRRALEKGFRLLAKNSLLGLRAPKEYGGTGLTSQDYFEATELLQSYSGALGFLQRQHQKAVTLIAKSEKKSLISALAKGKPSVGIAISHLRDSKKRGLEAKKLGERLFLNGDVHWVSGYRILEKLVLGFFISGEQKEGFALIPFQRSHRIKISKPIETIALSSLQTAKISFKKYEIPKGALLFLQESGKFAEGTSVYNSHFVNLSAIGRACFREFSIETPLLGLYQQCRKDYLERQNDDELPSLYGEMYKIVRALLELLRFDLGAKALLHHHPFERRLREWLLFSVIIKDQLTQNKCLKEKSINL